MAISPTILIVVRDSSVLGFLCHVLASQGYLVMSAQDEINAIVLFEGTADPIHLLIADIRMPRIHGEELAMLMRETRKGIGCLLVSGHSEDVEVPVELWGSKTDFLWKPFTHTELIQKVQNLLALVQI
jgi:two-component system, cell cycle sensor histidine kinase and response regulator CckA